MKNEDEFLKQVNDLLFEICWMDNKDIPSEYGEVAVDVDDYNCVIESAVKLAKMLDNSGSGMWRSAGDLLDRRG